MQKTRLYFWEKAGACVLIMIADNFPEHSDKKKFSNFIEHFSNTANIFILSHTQKRCK